LDLRTVDLYLFIVRYSVVVSTKKVPPLRTALFKHPVTKNYSNISFTVSFTGRSLAFTTILDPAKAELSELAVLTNPAHFDNWKIIRRANKEEFKAI
jgi:hypothetical protein